MKGITYFDRKNFENVPNKPGVYAWFYPLRIKGADLDAFFNDIYNAMNYDANSKGVPEVQADLHYCWTQLKISSQLNLFNPFNNSRSNDIKSKEKWGKYKQLWKELKDHDLQFIKTVFFDMSFFMPPLYVGKSVDLRQRCIEHRQDVSDSKTGNFASRFSTYAEEKKLFSKEVSDLLFACRETEVKYPDSVIDNELKTLEELVEDVMKCLCRPPYSIL